MSAYRTWAAARPLIAGAVVALVVAVPSSVFRRPWKHYTFTLGSYALQYVAPGSPRAVAPSAQPIPSHLAPRGDISASVLADVTGDSRPEWVLLLWRPWQDWPIQVWLSGPSLITGFHDQGGDSCHLVLVSPVDGREIWAGSALPVPLLALAVGDVDGDGENEIVTLEGDYDDGRDGTAKRVEVWGWHGFGFLLEWRSEPLRVRELRLFGNPRTGILSIGVR